MSRAPLLSTNSPGPVRSGSVESDEGADRGEGGATIVGLIASALRLRPLPHMPTRDAMTLGPIEKWQKYRRFPCKLLLHILTIALIIAQITLLSVQFTAYSRAAKAMLGDLFVRADVAESAGPLHYSSEFVNVVNSTVKLYHSFPNESVTRWLFVQDSVFQMNIHRWDRTPYNPTDGTFYFGPLTTSVESYNLTLDSLPPFEGMSHNQLNEYMYTVNKVELHFSYVNVEVGGIGSAPVQWDVSIHYDFASDGGVVEGSLSAVASIVLSLVEGNDSFATLQPQTAVSIALAIVAGLHGLLSIRELYRGYQLYHETREQFPKGVMLERSSQAHHASETGKATSWDDVPFSVKRQFFSGWALVSVGTSMLLVSAGAIGIVEAYTTSTSVSYHLALGMGGFLCALTFMRYLIFSQRFYTLALTVRLALSRVSSMLLSALPIFSAYCIFGVVVFSQYSDRFSSLDKTAVSLFALLNGDDIHDTFRDLDDHYPFALVSRVYLYTFVAFFITSILNLFIFLIEDSFMAAKRWVWKDEAKFQSRYNPFDINQLFDTIEHRKQVAARNVAAYFRARNRNLRHPSRGHGSAAPSSSSSSSASVAGGIPVSPSSRGPAATAYSAANMSPPNIVPPASDEPLHLRVGEPDPNLTLSASLPGVDSLELQSLVQDTVKNEMRQVQSALDELRALLIAQQQQQQQHVARSS